MLFFRNRKNLTRKRSVHQARTKLVHLRSLRVEPLEERRMLSITLFVDDDAAPNGDGLAWDSAYNDLQFALTEAATHNGDTDATNNVDAIWVAEGTYTPSKTTQSSDERSASFSLLNHVSLYGGFTGTETSLESRDWTKHQTILSGNLGDLTSSSDNAYTVVYCASSVTSTIDGFTVVDGQANNSSNGALSQWGDGGGIYNAGILTVNNTKLSNNLTANYGGGLFNEGTVTITNSIFSNNSGKSGGGLGNEGDLTIANSAIFNTPRGGGLFNNGSLFAANITVAHNLEGIINLSDMTMVNSTVVQNRAGIRGGGIMNGYVGASLNLSNCIVAGNWAPDGPDIYIANISDFSGSNNLIGNGANQSLVNGIDGNIVGSSSSPIDPMLSNWTQFNNGVWGYYLTPSSPAANAGATDLATTSSGQPLTEDIAGNTRVVGSAVDMGAVEGIGEPIAAQTYIVTSLDNVIAKDGILTFIEAFEAAERNQPVGDASGGSFAEQDLIQFKDGLSGTIQTKGNCFKILGDLSIQGSGSNLVHFEAEGEECVFEIPLGVNVSLSGMTITGGENKDSRAVLNRGALTVSDAALKGNTVNGGGGIENRGTLHVSGAKFSGLAVTAIDNLADMTLVDSTISNNLTTGFTNTGIATIENATISHNSMGEQGGGIRNTGDLTVTNSTIFENEASRGGGVYNSGTLVMVNSIISNNLGQKNGGGIYNSATLQITNSTINGNQAITYNGGGICGVGNAGKITLNNSIVAGNSCLTGPDVNLQYCTLSGHHNLIGNGSGQTLINGEDGNLVGTSANSINPGLSEWTEVEAGKWRCYLLPGSPAIDAGDTLRALDSNGQSLTEDIYGNARVIGDSVNIGAVEGTISGPSSQTYFVTSLENTIAEDGILTFIEALEAANQNQPIGDAPAGSYTEQDVIQFADGLTGTIVPDSKSGFVVSSDLSIWGPGNNLIVFGAGDSTQALTVQPGAELSIHGLTVTGGNIGRGVYNLGNLAISNSIFKGNSENGRGGIYNLGTLSVANSTFSEHSSSAIINNGSATITDCIISNNSSSYGGGIFNQNYLVVTNSTISDNVSSGSGGGISNSGEMTIKKSAIFNNIATGDGGGIYSSGNATITASRISHNITSDDGGGIYNQSNLEIANTIISSNIALHFPTTWFFRLQVGVAILVVVGILDF